MEEQKRGNFVKINRQQGIVTLIYLALVLFAWLMTKPTIMGISASQWILSILALTFPIVNTIRLSINRKNGKGL